MKQQVARIAGLAAVCMVGMVTLAWAQPKGVKFGQVNPDEFADARLERDPDANVVVIINYGEGGVEVSATGVSSVFQRYRRMYIRRAQDLEYWGNVFTPEVPAGSSLSNIKVAVSEVKNGVVERIELNAVKSVRETPTKGFVRLRFNIPNLKEGQIVEFLYKLSVPNSLYLPGWDFQLSEPVLHSEYKLAFPSSALDVKEINRGGLPFTDRTIGNGLNTYIMKDVPAMREEPYVYNIQNFRSSIDFYYTRINYNYYNPTWGSEADLLVSSDDLRRRLKLNSDLKATLAKITAGKTSDRAKMDTIYRWVQQHTTWNQTHHRLPDPISEAVAAGKPVDSGTINWLLIAMLREAGLTVRPTMLSTRSHMRALQYYPNSSQFNHTIAFVKLDSAWTYADASDTLVRYPLLPAKDYNYSGWQVDMDTKISEFVDLTPVIKYKQMANLTARLTPEGSIEGDFFTLYAGAAVRNELADLQETEPDKWCSETVFEGRTDVKQTGLQINKPAQAPDPLTATGKFTLAEAGQTIADKLYLNPLLLMRMEENVFVRESRSLPVEFPQPTELTYNLILELPPGAQVVEMPKSQRYLFGPQGDIQFTYRVSAQGNRLTVQTNYLSKTSILPSEVYPDLRAFMDNIRNLMNQQVVIQVKS